MLFFTQKIVFVNKPVNIVDSVHKTNADFLILSGNPRLYISDLLKTVVPKKIIITGSVPAWKAAYWKKDCDSLQIPYHDVSSDGAFVWDIK